MHLKKYGLSTASCSRRVRLISSCNILLFSHLVLVPASEFFPLGVRFFYKLFSAEKVVMIEPDPQDEWLGIKAWEICPKWLPEDRRNADGELIKPGGMYILWKLPTAMLEPEPLVPGSHIELSKIYYKISLTWQDRPDYDDHLKDWERFVNIAPKTDDVYEYLKEHPEQFYVPFREMLFRGNL